MPTSAAAPACDILISATAQRQRGDIIPACVSKVSNVGEEDVKDGGQPVRMVIAGHGWVAAGSLWFVISASDLRKLCGQQWLRRVVTVNVVI